MVFIRKLIVVIGKGPTVATTAGVIGASVSIPQVVDNVGPRCLEVVQGVFRPLTKWRHRHGADEAHYDKGWEDIVGIEENELSERPGLYPCYSVVNAGGGLYGKQWFDNTELTSNQDIGAGDQKRYVKRFCGKKIWDKVRELIAEFEKELRNEKLSRVREALKELSQEEDENKVEEKAKKVYEEQKKVMKDQEGYTALWGDGGKSWRDWWEKRGMNFEDNDIMK